MYGSVRLYRHKTVLHCHYFLCNAVYFMGLLYFYVQQLFLFICSFVVKTTVITVISVISVLIHHISNSCCILLSMTVVSVMTSMTVVSVMTVEKTKNLLLLTLLFSTSTLSNHNKNSCKHQTP